MNLHTNHPYVVIVTMSPEPNPPMTYGIKNVVTGVTEAYISQLAKAIWCADFYARELKEGIVTDREAALSLVAALKTYGEDNGPSGAVN